MLKTSTLCRPPWAPLYKTQKQLPTLPEAGRKDPEGFQELLETFRKLLETFWKLSMNFRLISGPFFQLPNPEMDPVQRPRLVKRTQRLNQRWKPLAVRHSLLDSPRIDSPRRPYLSLTPPAPASLDPSLNPPKERPSILP